MRPGFVIAMSLVLLTPAWAAETAPVTCGPGRSVAACAQTPDSRDSDGCCLVRTCPAGRVRTADTDDHCCWTGQAWSTLRQLCVGVPTACPPTMGPIGESCEVLPETRKAGDAYTWDVSGTPFTTVWVPPGTFMMGRSPTDEGAPPNEGPVEVTLLGGYEIMRTEVTQGLWKAVTGSNPAHFSACGDSCPVENVSWLDAVGFANALSAATSVAPAYLIRGQDVRRLTASSGWRLPTDAEWERAARAGSTARYSGGTDVAAVAWHEANAAGTTHPVCGKNPNLWGLCDMTGNVWEWVWDSYSVTLPGGENPAMSGPSDARVTRGGAWTQSSSNSRVARRYGLAPSSRTDDLGLRLVRSGF